jgi:hypothetical protein
MWPQADNKSAVSTRFSNAVLGIFETNTTRAISSRNAGAVARAPATVVGAASGQRVSEISYHSLDGAKSKGPSMSIKFEGKPPFHLE